MKKMLGQPALPRHALRRLHLRHGLEARLPRRQRGLRHVPARTRRRLPRRAEEASSARSDGRSRGLVSSAATRVPFQSSARRPRYDGDARRPGHLRGLGPAASESHHGQDPRHRAHRLSRGRQDDAAEPHPHRAARQEIRRHRQRVRRDRHRQRPRGGRRRGSVRDEQRLHLLHGAGRPDPHPRRADEAPRQVRRHHRRDDRPRRPGPRGADLLRRPGGARTRRGSTPSSRWRTPNGSASG